MIFSVQKKHRTIPARIPVIITLPSGRVYKDTTYSGLVRRRYNSTPNGMNSIIFFSKMRPLRLTLTSADAFILFWRCIIVFLRTSTRLPPVFSIRWPLYRGGISSARGRFRGRYIFYHTPPPSSIRRDCPQAKSKVKSRFLEEPLMTCGFGPLQNRENDCLIVSFYTGQDIKKWAGLSACP